MPTAVSSDRLSAFKALLPRMTSLLKKYWFFAGIVLVIVYASGLHGQNLWVQEYHVLTIGIFLAFFVTGFTLDTSGLNFFSRCS